MSKWLDRLASLPQNSSRTNPALTEPTKGSSVSFVSTDLGESDFGKPSECTSSKWETPYSALTKLTEVPVGNSGVDEEPGLPVAWLEGYRRLVLMRRPYAIPATTWTWLGATAGELLTRWGVQLAAHGWSTVEVFGVHYEEPMPHIAHGGLLAHLAEHRKLEAIGPRSAALRLADGTALRINRPLAAVAGIVLAWELTTGEPPHSTDETSA
jgi:hypothetical protein